MPHLVVIGDLVASRRIAARAKFQERLQRTLAEISAANAASLASPYTLTLGDEFQAVYLAGRGVFADLCRLRAACLPARPRLSLAVGALSTAVNPAQALGMDGPAFHAAREGIDTLKKSGGEFALGGELPGDAATRDALIDLLAAATLTWKANRWTILAALLDGRAVPEIAEETALTEVAVYKNIRHARLESLALVLRGVEDSLLPAPPAARRKAR